MLNPLRLASPFSLFGLLICALIGYGYYAYAGKDKLAGLVTAENYQTFDYKAQAPKLESQIYEYCKNLTKNLSDKIDVPAGQLTNFHRSMQGEAYERCLSVNGIVVPK